MAQKQITTWVAKKLPPNIYNRAKLLYASLFNPDYFLYREDELFTKHVPVFQTDKDFVTAYAEALKNIDPRRRTKWRTHVFVWAVQHVLYLNADYIECGVEHGFNSYVALNYLRNKGVVPRNWYLVDTYQGWPEHQATEYELKHNNPKNRKNTTSFEQVTKSFKDYSSVKIIQGVVPEVLNEVKTDSVGFLHLDMNLVAPEISAAEYFWPILKPGGVILLDDFAYHERYRDHRARFGEFARARDVPILTLPTGQGLIVKV